MESRYGAFVEILFMAFWSWLTRLVTTTFCRSGGVAMIMCMSMVIVATCQVYCWLYGLGRVAPHLYYNLCGRSKEGSRMEAKGSLYGVVCTSSLSNCIVKTIISMIVPRITLVLLSSRSTFFGCLVD